MKIKFEECSWVEIKEFVDKKALIIIPIGAIEQHGLHLPVNTDMVISKKIAEGVVNKLKNKIPVLLSPDLWLAYNGKFIKERWPGSLTVSQETQKKLLYELTEDFIRMGFKKIMYINSHGQNLFTMESVSRLIADDFGISIPFVFEYKIAAEFMKKNRKSVIGGICHACELETSLLIS